MPGRNKAPLHLSQRLGTYAVLVVVVPLLAAGVAYAQCGPTGGADDMCGLAIPFVGGPVFGIVVLTCTLAELGVRHRRRRADEAVGMLRSPRRYRLEWMLVVVVVMGVASIATYEAYDDREPDIAAMIVELDEAARENGEELVVEVAGSRPLELGHRVTYREELARSGRWNQRLGRVFYRRLGVVDVNSAGDEYAVRCLYWPVVPHAGDGVGEATALIERCWGTDPLSRGNDGRLVRLKR